jgi:hypothetical protein
MQFNGGIGGGSGGGGPGINCQGHGTCSGNGSGNNNCFPAKATVLLPGGAIKRMDELATGDAVAVRLADGSLGYQPIYAWCVAEAPDVCCKFCLLAQQHIWLASSSLREEPPGSPSYFLQNSGIEYAIQRLLFSNADVCC